MKDKNKNKVEVGDLVTYDIFGVGKVLYRDEQDGKFRVKFKHGKSIYKQWIDEDELEVYKKGYKINKYGNELYLRLTELSLKYNANFEDVVERYINVENMIKQNRKSLEQWEK